MISLSPTEFYSSTLYSPKIKGLYSTLINLPHIDWSTNLPEKLKQVNGIGRNAIYALVTEMIAQGLILRTTLRTASGKFKGYRYQLALQLTSHRFPTPSDDDGSPEILDNLPDITQIDDNFMYRCAPGYGEMDNKKKKGASPSFPPPSLSLHPISSPSISPPTPKKKNLNTLFFCADNGYKTLQGRAQAFVKQEVRVMRRNDYPIEFETIWQAMPGAMRKSKGKAYQAWQKRGIEPGDVELLRNALEAQKREREKFEAHGLWVPQWKNATTWINQDCWEDDTSSDAEIEAQSAYRERVADPRGYAARIAEEKRQAELDAWARG